MCPPPPPSAPGPPGVWDLRCFPCHEQRKDLKGLSREAYLEACNCTTRVWGAACRVFHAMCVQLHDNRQILDPDTSAPAPCTLSLDPTP